MSLFSELKRRNVFRVAVAYLAAAWLITEVSETLFPLFGYGDAPARIVVTLLAIGFPLFLVFSWVFEFTPEGLKLEKDIPREESITPQTGKRIDRLIIVLLIAAVSYFAFDKFVLEPVRDAELVEETAQEARSEALLESYGDQSIAVLPFVNMSADPEQEYFSDGISEELLNHLSKIPQLRVISRSSTFSFKGKNVDIPTIAQQLNVAHIIEGSVRKAGNQVRITAQLIDARSDSHLWSESYDRELENIFAIQDEISEAIVSALKESLDFEIKEADQPNTTVNPAAHDAYLRGRYLVVQRTQSAVEGAIQEFEKAIRLDPKYALAYAELAMALALLGESDVAEQYVEQAMILDSNLAETHAAAGLLLSGKWNESHLEQALTHFEEAIRINPSYSIVHTWMASLLERKLGRYAEAFAASEVALKLNPMSIPARINHVTALMQRNRMDEARQELDKLAAIQPQQYLALRGELAAHGGHWAKAILGNLDVLKAFPDTLSVIRLQSMARQFAALGLEHEALEIQKVTWPVTMHMLSRPADAVTTAEARFAENPNQIWKAQLGLALAATGDYALARPILEKMWQFSGKRISLYNDLFTYIHAIALAAIYRESGEEGLVGDLLAAIRKDVRLIREAGIVSTDFPLVFNIDAVEGFAAYLAGERERGMRLIARGAENGYFMLPEEAYLQFFYDDPGFAALMVDQQARQARELKRFLAIICNNNPYKEVWQPAEGTCERHAIKGR